MNLTVPTGWSDVTPEQLRTIAHVDSLFLTEQEKRVAMFCRLAGVKIQTQVIDNSGANTAKYFLTRGDEKAQVDAATLMTLCESVRWVGEATPCDVACPFGWDRHLYDVEFGNYFRADALMLAYAYTGEADRCLRAIRELDPKAEPTDDDVPVMRIWWAGFKEWLRGKYPEIYQKAEGGGTDGYNTADAWQNFMLMLNEGKPQENDRIEHAQLHDVLAAIQFKIQQAKEREAALKK